MVVEEVIEVGGESMDTEVMLLVDEFRWKRRRPKGEISPGLVVETETTFSDSVIN